MNNPNDPSRGYPPQPPSQGGYPPPPGGYPPPHAGGFHPQQGGHPPHSGYPPQQGGYPPPGYPPPGAARPGGLPAYRIVLGIVGIIGIAVGGFGLYQSGIFGGPQFFRASPSAIRRLRRRPPAASGANTPYDPNGSATISAPPAAAGQQLRNAPSSRRIAGSISNADYPASAIRSGAQGTVRARLSPYSSGAVSGCSILSSAGSSDLDSVTCSLMQRRYPLRTGRTDISRGNRDVEPSAIGRSRPDAHLRTLKPWGASGENCS
jgi:TonB family protein